VEVLVPEENLCLRAKITGQLLAESPTPSEPKATIVVLYDKYGNRLVARRFQPGDFDRVGEEWHIAL
jgi:hypothetical protein